MGSNLSNIIIIVILVVLVVVAVIKSIPHFKGEGGCCGGSGGAKRIKPKKLSRVTSVINVKIGGMHCEHCYARVQNALNLVDGLSARVYGSRNLAVVKSERAVDNEEITKIITELGYNVESIK